MPAAAAYLVAISAMLFAAASGLILFYAVEHFDPPDVRSQPDGVKEQAAA